MELSTGGVSRPGGHARHLGDEHDKIMEREAMIRMKLALYDGR